ncbi:MAG: alpha-amylase family protein [Clostridiaceae bacterium]|nr:alpha-amylase family protein [Clostridiaceae bacterium]
MKWWEQAPMVISAIQCNYGEDSFENLQKQVVERSFNTEQLLHLTATGHWGYFEEERDGKKLDAYLAESRKHGIREIFYYNVHCVSIKTYEEHPDWAQLTRDGKPVGAYDVQVFVCLHSSWREHFLKELTSLCSHAIDGIFLDGPVIAQGACYCPACQKAFREWITTVKDIPVDPSHTIFDATPMEMTEYKVATMTEFIKLAYNVVKRLRGDDVLLYINNSSLHADVTGSRTRKLAPYVDMLGSEGGFVWVNRGTPIWTISAQAKLLATQGGGKPAVIFTAGDYKPWSYYMHTAAETGLYYAQTVAHGANVWYGIHGAIPQMETPGGERAVQWNRFLTANPELYHGTTQEARVALIWSQPSANYYASSVEKSDFTKAAELRKDAARGDHTAAFRGFFEILTREHVQFDVIDEVSLTDGTLDRYELALLPTVACMTKAQAAAVEAFVQRGGRLISTGDTGCFDEWGRETEPKLAAVQGVAQIEDRVAWTLSGGGYQRSARDSYVTCQLSWKLTPSANAAMRVRPMTDAKVEAEYCVPMASRYTSLPEEWFPAILTHRFGQGESVYFAGMLGEFFAGSGNPDAQRMIADAVAHMSAPLVETDAPASVEFVLRRKEDAFILHIINATGAMERPIQKLIAIDNVHVTLHLGRPALAIEEKTGGTVADFAPTADGCSFTLSRVGDYEAYCIR